MAQIRVRVTVHVGHIRPDQVAMHAFIREGGGPVQRDLERRGTNVLTAWRRDVPTGGRLQQSLRQQPGTRKGPGVTVIAGREGVTDYLGYYLYGTAPHVIDAHSTRPNPHLRFVANGAVMFRKRVHHPGNRAHNFIVKNLPVALR